MKNCVFLSLFATLGFFVADGFAAVGSLNSSGATIRPVSQYGLIQNVQDYSMNPFWNKNSPYNLNFPQPVYVTGPELNTADCQNAVSVLISAYCGSNNNCSGLRVSDVRPAIMLQLARMPGHNYASACSGYIDSEFDAYVENYSATIPSGTVSFPGGTTVNPNYNANEFKLENPYAPRDATWNGQEWMKEYRERVIELKELQSQNGVGNEHVVKADFPTTFADLSLDERTDVKKDGYEPFEGKSAYNPIKIESEEEYLMRQERRRKAYCQNRYAPIMATLRADLQTLQECKNGGIKIADCNVKGKYW